MACSATGDEEATENPQWAVKTFNMSKFTSRDEKYILNYFLSYLQTMEDWAADWDMESWEDVTVTPTEYWV